MEKKIQELNKENLDLIENIELLKEREKENKNAEFSSEELNKFSGEYKEMNSKMFQLNCEKKLAFEIVEKIQMFIFDKEILDIFQEIIIVSEEIHSIEKTKNTIEEECEEESLEIKKMEEYTDYLLEIESNLKIQQFKKKNLLNEIEKLYQIEKENHNNYENLLHLNNELKNENYILKNNIQMKKYANYNVIFYYFYYFN